MKQILLVDDYESGRHVLREKLEMQGYVCREVKDGAEALSIIQQKHFDLVITDNQMPVMTGLELLQALAKTPKNLRLPIILLTGNLTEPLQKAAKLAGASAVLKKPYKDQELLSAITRILGET
ncbi:MAG: response regulator [Nitrospirales bacterium]|nr:response regulator [Nitrospirales bacterium]